MYTDSTETQTQTHIKLLCIRVYDTCSELDRIQYTQ